MHKIVKLTVTAAWAAFLGLETMAGCASGSDPGAEASERVATSAEPLVCNGVTCPADCKVYTCKLSCIASTTSQPDATPCFGGTRGTQAGVCVSGVCCTGCVTAKGGTVCATGTTVSLCGSGGRACSTCPHTADCTTESCSTGSCTHPQAADQTGCSTGRCVGGACCGGCIDTAGACQLGTSVNVCGSTGGLCSDCNDNQPCTKDTCDPTLGCVHTPDNTATCSDANACTTIDKCTNGTCVGTTPPNCDDNEACTKDTCDPKLGCVHTTVSGACDDGNACSTGDTCLNGKCTATGGLTCPDDGNPCTQNSCNPQLNQCTSPAEPNGTPCALDACHQNSICTNGKCGGGTAVDCNDNLPCTRDACDPTLGCTHVADPNGVCSDGDPCTVQDSCVNGKCTGTKVQCAALDECHKPGMCDPIAGGCTDPRQDDGFPCTDGNCKAGKCVLTGGGGGSATGGAAGEPGIGAAGEPGIGAAGEPSGAAGEAPGAEAGAGAGATGGSSSSAGTGTGGSATGGLTPPEHPFVREPGGCTCRTASRSAGSNAGWLLALAFVGTSLARRRRTARQSWRAA